MSNNGMHCTLCHQYSVVPEVRLITGDKVHQIFDSKIKAENYMFDHELLERKFTNMWIKTVYICTHCGREEIKAESFYRAGYV